MDSKLEYNLGQELEKVALSKISAKAMEIWKEADEGTELFNKIKELIDIIELEEKKIGDVRSILHLIASKL